MITIMCEKQKQFFIITIENRIVKYWDRFQGSLWGGPLQYLPPDYANVTKKINMSRNKIPADFKDMLVVTKEELAEYEAAKTDDELKDIVIRDIKRNQCKIIDMKID